MSYRLQQIIGNLTAQRRYVSQAATTLNSTALTIVNNFANRAGFRPSQVSVLQNGTKALVLNVNVPSTAPAVGSTNEYLITTLPITARPGAKIAVTAVIWRNASTSHQGVQAIIEATGEVKLFTAVAPAANDLVTISVTYL